MGDPVGVTQAKDDGAAAAAPLRVLIVEDEEHDQIAVLRAIQATGIRAISHVVGNLGTARAALTEGGFDAIFLDHHLPDGFGAEFARTLLDRGSMETRQIYLMTMIPDHAASLLYPGALRGVRISHKDAVNAATVRAFLSGLSLPA